MPKTLEEILKAEGFAEADLAAVAPLLGDARFRGAVEKQIGALETTLESYKTENLGWAKYDTETVRPALALYEKDKADAVALAASLQARLKLAEENGYAPRREEPVAAAGTPPPAEGGAFDPKKHKLVTEDDLRAGYSKFADLEGRAIAMAVDLAAEYAHLTGGKSLYEYEAEIDGRRLRGVSALREEAQRAKQDVYDYTASKFDFKGKREGIAAEQRKKAEDAIRADERSKVITQYGDPNVRPMMPSNNPFVPRQADGGKMPWETTVADRRKGRIERALQTQVQ